MVSVQAASHSSFKSKPGPLALFAFEDAGLQGASFLGAGTRRDLLRRAREEEGFKGKSGQTASVTYQNRRYVLAGLGKKGEFSPETLRRAAGLACRFCSKRFPEVWLSPPEPVQAAAEGVLLGSYRFEKYRKPDDDLILTAVHFLPGAASGSSLEAALQKARTYAEAVAYVRDLVNEGPSEKRPEFFAKAAMGLASQGVQATLVDGEQARKLGMGAFLGVARGSSAPPYFIHLVYKPKGRPAKKVGLIGKGITFDSGGLSLKPAQAMETMKMDMAGGATVLSVLRTLPKLKSRAEVHGFIPVTYNMPGPDAIKPGDIVRAMNGKTIEILNTDAEGRLILADALSYACRQKLDILIDVATLTGAALVALGSSVTAAMTNDSKTLEPFFRISKRTGERIWELPLIQEYKEHIKSSVADLQNISKVRGEAGTIIGGLFLQEFVDGAPWIHFDIAGPAWTAKDAPYCPEGGTGVLVRTLLEYLTNP